MKNKRYIFSLIAISLLTGPFISAHQSLNAFTSSTIEFHFSKTVQTPADQRERAVAFRSIQFIDSVGRVISEIRMGTEEANALQGEGWFDNEYQEGSGAYQWAGGPAKLASIDLDVPEGTEGLLLLISSIEEGLYMEVRNKAFSF